MKDHFSLSSDIFDILVGRGIIEVVNLKTIFSLLFFEYQYLIQDQGYESEIFCV